PGDRCGARRTWCGRTWGPPSWSSHHDYGRFPCNFKGKIAQDVAPCVAREYSCRSIAKGLTARTAGLLSKTCLTTAWGVNNAGSVVGYYYNYTGPEGVNGFLDVGGVFTTVDVPGARCTTITGINNSGQIVGYDYDDVNGVAGPTYGFLATPVSAVPEPSSLTISVVAIALVLAIKLRFFR